MEENLKKLLRDMQDKENTRKNEINQVNAEMARIDLREETETDRFVEGIEEDIKNGVYNNRTDGQMQKVIDDEKEKIKSKYSSERLEISNKLEEMKKQQDEEKKNDYGEINSGIKEYHLDMVLEVNKANNELKLLENERDEKLKEIDNQISAKETEYTYMIMQNRNSMDIEQSEASIDIRALGQEIEELRATRIGLDKEYGTRLKEKSDLVKKYSEQKERASKFMSSIRLSEKTVNEIYEILFDEEPIKTEKDENTDRKKQKEEISTEQNKTDREANSAEQTENNRETNSTKQTETNRETNSTEQTENNRETNSTENLTSSVMQEEKNETNPDSMRTTVVSMDELKKQSLSSKSNKEKNNKFSYEFSVKKGIKYDGKDIDIDDILIWYDENANEIEDAITEALGDREKQEDIEWFLLKADKLIYSTIFKDATVGEAGKIIFGSKEKERIQAYYDMWSNPKSQEESNMTIKYNLKGMSKLQRFFRGSQLRDEEILDIKQNAFLLRNRKGVQIEKGLMTAMYYKIMDGIENVKNVKRIGEATNQENEKEKEKEKGKKSLHQKFVERLNPLNTEYEQSDKPTSKKSEEKNLDSSRDEDDYFF